MKVVIVGGGVMGTAIACELVAAGLEVTVLERSIPGAEASTAAAGMLAPQLEAQAPGPMLDLSLRSRGLYPAWVKALTAESGVETGYLESGALQLAFTEAQAHELEATVAWQQAAGLRAALLSGGEVRALEPNVSPEVVAAAHFPDDHQVDPRKLMQALTATALRRGVRFTSVGVAGLLDEQGTVAGIRHDSGELRAELTIVAAGAWTSLLPGVGVDERHLKPARGQLVELALGASPLKHVLKSGLGYVVPRADGHVVCGTTVELVGFDKRVTAAGLASVLTQATRACPRLEGASVAGFWAGLRPWTEDGLPLLGTGHRPGLLIASGHYRNGILLAPITARLIGQLVRGDRPAMDLRPFRPARFSGG
ncbi:MAG: glycine oxidase ThiO [Myxococcaceae bacterium]|nr:glycine oxidase ThiO [Myxococcaceae bacterium]